MSQSRRLCAAWRGVLVELGLCVTVLRCEWACWRLERLQRRCARSEVRVRSLLQRVAADLPELKAERSPRGLRT